jgi:hypothetical protein
VKDPTCTDGTLNDAGNGCKTPVYQAADGTTPASCSNSGTIKQASCSNGGSVNDAGDGCKTPAFTAADNNAGTDASCADGEVNDAGDACKAVVFTDIGCETPVLVAPTACKSAE